MSRTRFHFYKSAGKWWCAGAKGGRRLESWGDTAEVAFVKWLIYWGTRSERLEYATMMEKYRGDLWSRWETS